MSWYDRLERRFGKFAIGNMTVALLFGQGSLYLLSLFGQAEFVSRFELVPALVMQGEVWRLFSFILMPSFNATPVFFIFWLMLFHMMGTALEHEWGDFRFNLFLLSGWAATVAVSFLTPYSPAGNGFVMGSIFLAFAYLWPDFEINIYFLFPVRVRWLALLTWAGFGWVFITRGAPERLAVAAATLNFFLFFGADMLQQARWFKRRNTRQAVNYVNRREFSKGVAARACAVCGAREADGAELRYCSKCEGEISYCAQHIREHEHKA